jgi:membrane protease YdiL (CAAX protease family)
MLRTLKKYPLVGTVLVFILFIFIVFALSSVLGYQTIGGYVSPFVLLLLTWLLYKKQGKNLSELGLDPKRRNIYFLPLGLLTGILFLTFALFVQTINEKITFQLNPNANYSGVAVGLFFLLQGVLNEELIFRGYCLDKTMQRIGIFKANLVFAFLFMVWHWISWNAWGNYGMMLSSITTAFGHFLFATALLSARTLYFSIGIHLGINWASNYLFSLRDNAGRIDVLFNVSTAEQTPTAMHDLTNILLTLLCYLAVIGLIWKAGKRRLTTTS